MHKVVRMYPITTPMTAASISILSQADFSRSLPPKVSAQTGKKIETNTWQIPVRKREVSSMVKSVVWVNKNIEAQFKTNAPVSTYFVLNYAYSSGAMIEPKKLNFKKLTYSQASENYATKRSIFGVI